MAWLALLRGLEAETRLRQVRAINEFVNRWRYKADADNYGKRDHWATPLEFLRRSGDCEDYAIAKYESLRRLGLPADPLRLVVVQDTVRDLPHAVLAVYLADEVYILDNLSDAVLPQRRVSQLRALLLGQRGRPLGPYAAATPSSSPAASSRSSRRGPSGTGGED